MHHLHLPLHLDSTIQLSPFTECSASTASRGVRSTAPSTILPQSTTTFHITMRIPQMKRRKLLKSTFIYRTRLHVYVHKACSTKQASVSCFLSCYGSFSISKIVIREKKLSCLRFCTELQVYQEIQKDFTLDLYYIIKDPTSITRRMENRAMVILSKPL